MTTVVTWLLVGVQAVGALLTVQSTGKPRKPIDSTTAMFTVVLSTLIILGVLFLGGII